MTKPVSGIAVPAHSLLLDKDFIFGVATSSYQIEGGTDKDWPCIWDSFCEQPGAIRDESNGGIACKHVDYWRTDTDLISDLGVDAYRLSISWPRVMDPEGELIAKGISFYRRLLSRLKQKGIKTWVTLYHWDLPQYLEDHGGWLNRDTAFAFFHYAKRVTAALADLVDSWTTLNEPFCSAYLGYEIGIHAPGKLGKQNGKKAAHHLLLAHGLAMQAMQETVPDTPKGIVLNFSPCYPASDSQPDHYAARLADDSFNQWYIKPILEGEYPELLSDVPESYRPDIQSGDMDIISHPIDFIGVNYYTRTIYASDGHQGFKEVKPGRNVQVTAMGWEVFPDGLRDLLTDLNKRYTLPPVYITENGAAFHDQDTVGHVHDEQRTHYINQHFNAVHQAVEQGVDVRGFFVWSLMDNFEWAEGYTQRFGIIHVDYRTQQREFKTSALAYQRFLQQRAAMTLSE